MRAESHRILDRVDSRFLAAVYALLQTYEQESERSEDEIIGYSIDGQKPIYASEADQRFSDIVDDVKKGNGIEIEDFLAKKVK